MACKSCGNSGTQCTCCQAPIDVGDGMRDTGRVVNDDGESFCNEKCQDDNRKKKEYSWL